MLVVPLRRHFKCVRHFFLYKYGYLFRNMGSKFRFSISPHRDDIIGKVRGAVGGWRRGPAVVGKMSIEV